MLAGWKGINGIHLCLCVILLEWHEWTRSSMRVHGWSWAEIEERQRKKWVSMKRVKERESSLTNPLCFSFLSIKKKTHFFFSRLYSFLTAAMCLISDVICSRPWAKANTAAAAIFTLKPKTKTGKHNSAQGRRTMWKISKKSNGVI